MKAMLALLMFALMVSANAPYAGETASPALSAEAGPALERPTIQPGLEMIMEPAEFDDRFEVIIQFDDAVDREELDKLESLDFEIYRELPHVNGVYCEGEKWAIRDLSEWSPVEYIEFNAPLRPLMNVSTETIFADDVWDRIVLRDDGEEVIDGSGVTVVVLDSGIDATHPDLDYTFVDIESGQIPQPGDKVIFNAKKDQDIAGEPWVQFINTDTTSGHGTHCAGTVAGWGSASAEDKSGVAPNAWLIGLSMGELFMTIDEYSGLVWVYEHSRPDDNPANIRVVTNSWGPGYPFDALDPNSASVQVIEDIVYDNNVAVVFAAGNDGSDNHDGTEDTTNIFAKVPGAIGVAAAERDASGLAGFTSRGDASREETWPDVAAPGVRIWSAAARATMIGGGIMGADIVSGSKLDPYYLAISGTSMATPHVAGLAALLWQACPSMTISDVLEEGWEEDSSHGEIGSQPYIHELEWILKATADYIDRDPGGDNGVPANPRNGILDKEYDFAQGYGMVNASKAVAVALVLDKMRDPDHDGEANHLVSVQDAYDEWRSITFDSWVGKSTNVIVSSWTGEFIHPWELVDDSLEDPLRIYSRLLHRLYIPDEAVTLNIVLDITDESIGSLVADLYVTIDSDGDGNPDWEAEDGIIPVYDDHKRWVVHVGSGDLMSDRGRPWSFNVTAHPLNVVPAHEFKVTVEVVLDSSEDPRVDWPGYRFGEPTDDYQGGTTTLHLRYYDVRSDEEEDKTFADEILELMPVIVLGTVLAVMVYLVIKKRDMFQGDQ